MDWERSLREQVNSKIEHWRHSREGLPFTVDQLLVMALIDLGESAVQEAIHEWLFEGFRYYRKLAVDVIWKFDLHPWAYSADEQLMWRSEARKFKRQFLDVFNRFDIPIKEVKRDDIVHWTVSIPEARIYLQPILRDQDARYDQ